MLIPALKRTQDKSCSPRSAVFGPGPDPDSSPAAFPTASVIMHFVAGPHNTRAHLSSHAFYLTRSVQSSF